MDFDLSEDQRLLKDSVDRLVLDQYQFEQRKKYMREPAGYSAAMWDQITEMGLLGLPFEETLGGFGGGAVETAIVMEAFGRGLVLEPYFATVILGGGLLRRTAPASVLGALAPKVASGKLKLAFAHVERHSRYNLADVSTTAHRDGSGYLLDGAKSVVIHGDVADRIFVTARIAGQRRARDGIGLFLIDPSIPGVTRRGYPTQDGQRAAEITLQNVRVGADDLLNDNALPLVEHVVDEAIAALCAEAVGAMQSMQDLTLEYLKTRKQFGRPIGSFQVLQHRSVDMLVAIEQARSMAMFAAVMAAEEDPIERRKAISAAKVQIGRSGRHVGQEAIQLHGGIGMTNEYAVGHYFKRVTMIDQLYGDADTHLSYLAEAGGLFSPAAPGSPSGPAATSGLPSPAAAGSQPGKVA
jgi:pimeloyl-CoA dehydrogenase small subunit